MQMTDFVLKGSLCGLILSATAVMTATSTRAAPPTDQPTAAADESVVDTVALQPARQALKTAFEEQRKPWNLRHTDERRLIWDQLQQYYGENDFTFVWLGDAGGPQPVSELLAILRGADTHGLMPAEYGTTQLQRSGGEDLLAPAHAVHHLRAADPQRAAALELALSVAFAAYAHDMWDGRVEPADVSDDHEVYLQRPRLQLGGLLDRVARESVNDILGGLQPRHPAYAVLRDELTRLKQQLAEGEYLQLEYDELLEEGDQGEPVYALMQRLSQSGDYRRPLPAVAADAQFDEAVVAAVKRFQERSAISADGLVGPETRSVMNIPLSRWIERVVVNLDRWRWLPRDLGPRYVLVNIPEYHMWLYEDNQLALEMSVIVGTTMNRTPIFSDRMEYLVFSPYWNIPYSIVRDELLPQFREDPATVTAKNMEVLDQQQGLVDPFAVDWQQTSAADIRVRQKPGSHNSLGLVKFMFPNSHAIYLHDTPADSLFDRSQRDFSHGCVRVEDPVTLAAHLLRDQPQWQRSEIRDAMHGGEETRVDLKQPLPVYITYFTAMPDGEGEVRLLADVYEHDQLMRNAMRRETDLPVVNLPDQKATDRSADVVEAAPATVGSSR